MSKLFFILNYNTRYVFPLLIGLIIGFAFSLLCMPFLDCETNYLTFNLNGLGLHDENGNLINDPLFIRSNEEANRRELDDFEPRINLQGKPKKPQKTNFKLVRPRYAAIELGIREKLFVGVLTNMETLNTLAIDINHTISAHANKLIFFVNNVKSDEKSRYNSIPRGLSVISFNDDHEILKPFHTIQYILDNHINNYDWFFIVADQTLLRGEKVKFFAICIL
jgi:chondroitin polymerizing factor